ncbi:ER transporter-like protein 1 [Elsinoe fawcettii]|nr:ER transporter-like protein 1 [Elsinoe fawcettii]
MASGQEEIEPKESNGESSSHGESAATRTATSAPSAPGIGKPTEKKSILTKVKELWAKTGLDPPTMMIMAKGGLAPTIALAAFQATDFAETYTTLGYLVGIVSILSFSIMPRAKFLQTMFYLLFTTCFASAVALLAIYCCVQARLHTTPEQDAPGTGGAGTTGTPSPGASTAPYNSSASAVAAIWLFVEVWLINTMRARNPALTIPGIVAAIFANVSLVYAPQFSAMSQGISFARRLLEAFMTGFAICTGVSLFIFPVTMRQVVFKEMTGYIMTLRKVMGAHITYIESLEEANMFNRTPTGSPDTPRTPQAQAIKDIMAGLAALHGKLSIDLVIAKREVAIGKLGPDDLQELFRRLRSLLLPITGLSSVTDVFERITEEYGWEGTMDNRPLEEIEDDNERHRAQAVQDWQQLSSMLKDPFSKIVKSIDDGFAHVLFTLELVPRPKKAEADIEGKADLPPSPGEVGFSAALEKQVEDFRSKKSNLLKKYAELRNIKLPADFFDRPRTAQFEAPDWYYRKPENSQQRTRYRRQLFLVLYMDFLLESIARNVHDFCKYADEKAETKLRKKRLIVPGLKRLRKWIKASITHKADNYTDEQHGMNEGGGRSTVYLGDAYHKRKDPEHLPPTTTLQKFGDKVRAIPHFLRSPASMFGLRVAMATMSLAIIAYLRDTQQFYVVQRLFWAQIMVTISMSPSAGQSIFSFALRILGTLAAMITSFIIWYIVDGRTPGVLVFFWIFVMWGFYIVLKFPKITPVGMIFSVTNTLIIGYELQTRKIGIQLSESNGQAYYPIYELAPYRLATVCAGIFVAWIWTIFPWPISEHSELRRDLGASLYLLANYYSVVDSTVRVRVSGDLHSLESDPSSPLSQLDKARQKVFSKSLLLLQALRTHADFIKFDFPIGGKFPAATYRKTIARVQSILNFTSLLVYSSQTFADMYQAGADEHSESEWLRDFRRLNVSAASISKEVTTLLALLSASVSSGQPLPPYIQAPEPYALSQKLDEMDKDILSIRHLVEPGYAAFACMQIATRCIGDDLAALLRDVRELVGEMDFSFTVIEANDLSTESVASSGRASKDGVRKRRIGDGEA